MKIEYGPPGHKGVTRIQGLGEANNSIITRPPPLQTTGGAAVATWLLGMLLGSNTLKNMGLGAGGAVLLVKTLQTRQAKEAVTPVKEPLDVQGWG